MQVKYTAHGTAYHGGRNGTAATDDGKVSVKLSVPKAMGGDDGPGTNPEQLFAIGYAACFLGAMRGAAGRLVDGGPRRGCPPRLGRALRARAACRAWARCSAASCSPRAPRCPAGPMRTSAATRKCPIPFRNAATLGIPTPCPSEVSAPRHSSSG